MTAAKATVPCELVQQFKSGNGTLFVGAGPSIGAGLPSWGKLVDALAQELEGIPSGTTAPDLAQYYLNEHGKNRLVTRLREELNTFHLRPTPSHAELARVRVPVMVTTNFEDLLEQALHQAQRPFTLVVEDYEVAFADQRRLLLVKLHGDLNRPDSIVLTSSDYERYLVKKPALSRQIAQILQSRTVLFIGYSVSDNNLRAILTQVRDEAGEFARNLFTVQFEAPPLVVKELERRGLKVINLPAGPDRIEQLRVWLHELNEQVGT
jgi:hypothetical protein